MAEVEISGSGAGGDAVEAAVGDDVVIRLPENATTGYLWSVHSVGEGLTLVSDATVPAGSGVPGAAGEHVVRLRATAPATAGVVLCLGRPWAPEPAERWRIAVTIHPARPVDPGMPPRGTPGCADGPSAP